MQARGHVNARADECTVRSVDRGQPTVLFQGEAYHVIGFYFARKHQGPRDLFYVLRPLTEYGQGLCPLDEGDVTAR